MCSVGVQGLQFPQIRGTFFGNACNKDFRIWSLYRGPFPRETITSPWG